MTTTYASDKDGVIVAAVPERCPMGEAGGRECVVGVHHERPRKTGPCFPLTVGRCATHARAFTLYPPGHRPYGRKAVVAASVQGELVLAAAAEGSRGVEVPASAGSPPGPRCPAWRLTMFDAAVDAAHGAAWPREGAAATGLWNTQRRALDLGARLLGLHPTTTDRTRERIALVLEVPCLSLRDAARDFASARGYRGRGAALAGVLGQLPLRRQLVDALPHCGAIAGLWGQPSRWDPGGRALRSVPVPVAENAPQ